MATADATRDDGRGREAGNPGDIPKEGWKDILIRTKDEISDDNIDMIAAGIAFYALFAIVPALGSLVSIYGLIADPHELPKHFATVAALLPKEAAGLINEQLERVANAEETSLGFAAIFALLLTLYSATKGIKAIFTGLNVAYDEEERRSFIKYNLMAFLFTLGAVLSVIIALGVIVGIPAVLKFVGLGGAAEWLIAVIRWPILGALVIIGMAVLYRYGPSRDRPKWQWISWGAVSAAIIWIVGSMLFSLYVTYFENYNETYGSLGAVLLLLMWFYISAFVVLAGAELNSEMEHQTRKDTTEGPEQPMGSRDANMADTLGEAKGA